MRWCRDLTGSRDRWGRAQVQRHGQRVSEAERQLCVITAGKGSESAVASSATSSEPHPALVRGCGTQHPPKHQRTVLLAGGFPDSERDVILSGGKCRRNWWLTFVLLVHGVQILHGTFSSLVEGGLVMHGTGGDVIRHREVRWSHGTSRWLVQGEMR